MNMKRLLTLVAFFATLHASAQQVNPVPDYVFANRMSAGRNTVTDTAAYFSIGPRYGATRGMMPPMVVDTASFSANKRNGLLIFSVQKNKFLYWDSVGVKWAEMAGTGGSAITGSGVAGYMPEFTTTTNLDTTRLYHSAGRFAIGSTTTSNGALSVYGGNIYTDNDLRLGSTTDWGVEAESTNFQVVQRTTNFRYLTIDSAGNVAFGRLSNATGSNASAYFNTDKELIIANSAVDLGNYKLQVNGNAYIGGNATLTSIDSITSPNNVLTANASGLVQKTSLASIGISGSGTTNYVPKLTASRVIGNSLIFDNGSQILINTTSAGGGYTLRVSGSMETTGATYLGTSGGKVLMNYTSASPAELRVHNTATDNQQLILSNAGTYHTGFIASQADNVLTDTYAWGMFGGSNSYISGLSYSAAIALAADVSAFRIIKNNNLNSTPSATHLQLNNSSGELLLGTTTDAGDYRLQVSGNIYNTGSLTTGAPSGGSIKPWKIGEAATVSPTSPNRTLRVEVDGVVYYIHAKTTND